jgi:hypothetical protein
MQYNARNSDFCRRLGLPSSLSKLIRTGQLANEVVKAYAVHDELNAQLDAWEAQNPDAAKLVPWFARREAWKRAGRPKANWLEVLTWSQQTRYVPIQTSEVEKDLLRLP